MSESTTYSEAQRDVVFRVWAFEANRSALGTSKRIYNDQDMRDLGVNDVSNRTILRWSKEYGWAQRADNELYALAPDLRFSAQGTLALAAPEAAVELRKILAMDIERDMPVTVGKGEDAHVVLVKMLDKDVLKAKVTAIQLTLDRTGFSPIGTRETGRLDTPPSVIDSLDEAIQRAGPDELDELEREIKKRLNMGSLSIGIGAKATVKTQAQ